MAARKISLIEDDDDKDEIAVCMMTTLYTFIIILTGITVDVLHLIEINSFLIPVFKLILDPPKQCKLLTVMSR
jgi:hypothetical protein